MFCKLKDKDKEIKRLNKKVVLTSQIAQKKKKYTAPKYKAWFQRGQLNKYL